MRPSLRSSLRSVIETSRDVMRDPPLLLWTLFLVFFPFYVFPSGLPQPADWLIIALFPMLMSRWNGRLLDMGKPFKVLLAFAGYATLLNLMWSFALATFAINLKVGFGLSPTFYIYNALVLFSSLLMYQRYGSRFLWLTVRVILIAVAIQGITSIFAREYALRSSLMFNSPNQLGCYALLCACILLLGYQTRKLSTLWVTLGLTVCCYLALISASKAALGSIAMLGIALLFARVRTIVVATTVLLVLAFTSNPFSRAIEKAQQRIDNDTSHGLLEERGYDRVIAHPEYWLFGSGEGAYERFRETTVIRAHELHSSAATLFFCYGIIGFSIFGAFVWLALRGIGWKLTFTVLPAFAYGMAHQGLRFSMMWVMFAFVMALRHERQQPPRAPPAP